MIAQFKKCSGVRIAAAIAVAWLLFECTTAPAAVLTWNSAASYPPKDGSGTWGTGGNWWNGNANVAWSNSASDTALFGAAAGASAGTVAISGSQSVGGIVFQSQAYTLGDSGGTLNLAGSATVVAVNACGGTIGSILTGSASMTKAGTGSLTLTTASPYAGPIYVSAGALQLNASNGASGAIASPTITVSSSGCLMLNAADALGYSQGVTALIINGGTVSNITVGGRITLENPIAMTGGLLTGSGTGDYGGVFSIDSSAGVTATSDSLGNPAIINASSISPEHYSLNFNIARGAAAPVSDVMVTSSIVPFKTNTYGIMKTGNGVLTLTGSNTYTGPTSVSSGTLLLGNGGTTGSLLPSGSINNDATLGFCRSNAVVQGVDFSSGGISGGGSLVQLGTGLLALNATNTYTGPTVVAGGTLSASLLADGGGASSIGRSSDDCSNLVLENGAVFQYTGSSVSIGRGFTVGAGGGGIDVPGGTQLQFGNALALGGTLNKTGSGTVRLTNYLGSAVSGGGAIVVKQGTIDFGGDHCYDTSPFGYRALRILVNQGGDLYISAPHALGGGTADANTSWGAVTVLGGTMSLAAEQYISGGTVNSLGRLVLQGATVNNAGAGELRATANTSCISTLASAQSSTIDVSMSAKYGPFVLDVADGPADADLLIPGNISSSGGSCGVAKLNAGKLVLTGSNSYAATTISGGTLQIGAGGDRGTLGFGDVVDNATLSFARSDHITVANLIGGSGALVQLGPGVLELTASNSYSGGTVVSGGTLVLDNRAAIEDGSSVTVGDVLAFSAAPAARQPFQADTVGLESPTYTSAAPAPEPNALVLAAFGLCCAACAPRAFGRRLRRR